MMVEMIEGLNFRPDSTIDGTIGTYWFFHHRIVTLPSARTNNSKTGTDLSV